eukprot:TRINITY_DN3937_c0_g1_i1.p2 TRINITY_DN3937_c0_g1~~TRINITY_DN3937_c0_g1_i1.p2  ORF type:complete len:313 (+),score=89.96 TRINITY_DN3937_c0_g1_i1:504-1442(+)
MSLKLFKTMWGVPELTVASKRKAMLARVVAAGFQGVEMHAVCWRSEGVMKDLHEAQLELVAQVHTSSRVDAGFEGFMYMTAWDVEDHLESLKTLATEAKQLGALAVNSHSGVDGWSVEQAREFLRGALSLEKELGIPIFHETHRRRLFWNPFNTRDILAGQADLADVKLNSDISHWVVCLERVFATEASFVENSDKVDPWWPEVLELLKQHCCMIHARVGYAEGPQAPNPAAPEYTGELTGHFQYWEQIVKAQIAQGKVSIIEPEHGPWPYQQSVPNTGTAPTHDIWEANDFIKEMVRAKFPQWVEQVKAGQ